MRRTTSIAKEKMQNAPSRNYLHITVGVLVALLAVLGPFIHRSVTGRFLVVDTPSNVILIITIIVIIATSILLAFAYGTKELEAAELNTTAVGEDYTKQRNIAVAFSGGGVRSAR